MQILIESLTENHDEINKDYVDANDTDFSKMKIKKQMTPMVNN